MFSWHIHTAYQRTIPVLLQEKRSVLYFLAKIEGYHTNVPAILGQTWFRLLFSLKNSFNTFKTNQRIARLLKFKNKQLRKRKKVSFLYEQMVFFNCLAGVSNVTKRC